MAAIFANNIHSLNIFPHLFHRSIIIIFLTDLTQQITLLTLSLLFLLLAFLLQL